jgi:hypothetical protein
MQRPPPSTEALPDDDWPTTYEFAPPLPTRAPPQPQAPSSPQLVRSASKREDECMFEAPPDAENAATVEEDGPAKPPATAPARIPFPNSRMAEHFPGFVSRSAIFAASGGKGFYAGKIESAPHYDIACKGPRLSMRDKAAWEGAVEAGRAHGWLGEEFKVSLSSIAKRMGAQGSGPDLAALRKRLERIAQVTVEFELLKGGGAGSGKLLLSVRTADGETWVALDPAFATPAFDGDWLFPALPTRRREFPTAAGQWLHDYFTINQLPNESFAIETLRAMCGYDAEAGRFASLVRDAMTLLSNPGLLGCAPGLAPVASFSFDKHMQREARRWSLTVARGGEKVSYAMPAHERAKRAQEKAAKSAEAGREAAEAKAKADAIARRRRGPSL